LAFSHLSFPVLLGLNSLHTHTHTHKTKKQSKQKKAQANQAGPQEEKGNKKKQNKFLSEVCPLVFLSFKRKREKEKEKSKKEKRKKKKKEKTAEGNERRNHVNKMIDKFVYGPHFL